MSADARKSTLYCICFECKKEWAADELIAAHNAVLDEITATEGPGLVGSHVTTPEQVFCCPKCIHDW